MRILNKKWVIYIYIIFLVTILVTNIVFISKYIFWNIELYNSIKNYYILYWINKWLDEEIVVNYYDDSKNIKYIDTKYFNKNEFISRYKDFIEYFLDEGWTYELSLTSLDEEYNNSLDNLKYIDLYWNTNNNNKCDMNISLIKWKKNDINSIINNKKILYYKDNVSILYAVRDTNIQDKINVYFSTWAYFNNSNLIRDNFLLNNNTIKSLSWALWNKEYELVLNEDINPDFVNILNIKENEIKDINWNLFISDNLILKKETNIYTNRYRISDSFWDIDKLNYEYKILITALDNCSFLLEWFDINNNVLKIPSNKLQWDFSISYYNTKLSIDKNFKIWIINLSNFLYKLH